MFDILFYVGVKKREDRRDGEATEAKGWKISLKQFIVSSILPKNERKKLKTFDLRVLRSAFSFFRSFFGRIEDTKICSRDFLTFRKKSGCVEFFDMPIMVHHHD